MKRKFIIIAFAFMFVCFFSVQSSYAATLLRLGSRGSEVVKLQQKLKDLGYLSGSVDGIFGSQTRSAVIHFQSDQNIAADGIAGTQTLGRLYSTPSTPSTTIPVSSETSSSPSSGGQAISRTLSVGSRGSDVAVLQKRLNELGFNCGPADGIFGRGTESAVKSYQKANGLVVDGIVGTNTINRLFSKTTSGENTEPGTPSTSPTETPSPTTNPTDESTNTNTDQQNSTSYPITSTLRYGSRGTQVVALQKRLNELGFNCGAADGIFGRGTEAAVKSFQTAQKLTADGIVGTNTIKALFSVNDSAPEETVPDEFQQAHGTANSLNGKVVIIDPGHGGSDTGANRDGIYEKNLNLDMAKRLQRILMEAGATVVLTRSSDTYSSLFYRSSFVNKYALQKGLNDLTMERNNLDDEKKQNEGLLTEKKKKKSDDTQLIAVKSQQLVEKQAAIGEIQDQLTSLTAKLPDLTATYENTEKVYADKQAVYAPYADQLKILNDALLQMQKDLSNLEVQKNQLVKEIEDVNIELTRLKNELDNLKAQSSDSDVSALINEKELAITNAENELSNKQAAYDSLVNTDIPKKQVEIASKEEEINQKTQEALPFSSELDKAKQDMDAAKKNLDDLTENIKVLTESKTAIQNQINLLEKDISDLTNGLPVLDNEIAALEEKIADLTGVLQEKNDEINDVNSKLAAFQTYLNQPVLGSREGIYSFVPGTNYANQGLTSALNFIGDHYPDNVIFLSIHCNSSGSGETTASGIQAYYLDYNSPASWGGYYYPNYYTGYNASKRRNLAVSLLEEMNAATDFSYENKYPMRKDFSILRENNMVSALVEVGYVNNPSDRARLVKEQFRENAASGIYKGILKYFQN